jgi:hypothetical protein
MPIAPDSPEHARAARRGGRMSELEEPAIVWPRATDLGRRPVLASGRGAVSTFRAEPTTVEVRPPRGGPVSGTPQRHGAGAAGAE